MLVYIALGLTLAAAFVVLWRLYRVQAYPISVSWYRILFWLSVSWLLYLYGTWVFLSIYLKHVFGIAVLLCLVLGFFRSRNINAAPRRSVGWHLFFSSFIITCCVLYFTGTTGVSEDVELTFPLRKGKYFVLQGGKGLPSNLFHYGYRGAIYAIDIVKLDDRGNRAKAIFSKKLEDYHIFNDTIFSPCDGLVARIRNDNPDNPPSVRKRGPSNINQVLIEADDYYVFLGHIKYNGVLVHEGDYVKKGDPLAIVGNSGFSLEPHLHIQVHKNTHTGLPWYKEPPLFIKFDGKGYLLFEVIRPKRIRMING